MSYSPVSQLIRDIGLQFPTAIVYLVGLVFGFLYLSRLPRVALLTGGGCGVLLLMCLVRPIVYFALNQTIRSGNFEFQNWQIVYSLIGFVFQVIEAAATAALLYAIFTSRPGATPTSPIPKPL